MRKDWTLHLDPALLQRLRQRHAETYASHRLSFNRWLCTLLEGALGSTRARLYLEPREFDFERVDGTVIHGELNAHGEFVAPDGAVYTPDGRRWRGAESERWGDQSRARLYVYSARAAALAERTGWDWLPG